MSKKLWGGRFSKPTDPLVEDFSRSIQYDYKLAEYDVVGSMLHVKILEKAGYLKALEFTKLISGLKAIYASIKNESFKADIKCEDIHTDIQNKLQKKIGNLALKLHTARSRNDQVVFATKVYAKVTISEVETYTSKLILALNGLAKKNDFVIPGFTHMQHAQPVYLKDYLGAYADMLERDIERLGWSSKNIKINFGSGALAGTPIDSSKYAVSIEDVLKGADNLKEFKELIFVVPTENSLDAVSDRDFVIEILSALSILGMHLSRLAEDLIIWSTKEFDFVEIDEPFCTGSSLMPQKKNADSLELIRGYAGRLYGNLVSVLTMMKGLPLTYNRDMQLDKEPLFNSFEITSMELKVLEGLIKTLKFNQDKIKEYLKDEGLYATDLVYYLVDKGVAFKEAHSIVGNLVKHSLEKGILIKHMSESQLKKISAKFVHKEIIKLFDPQVSVKSKRSIKR